MPVVERDHALDALRAAMMLLGIVLHAGLSYTHLPTRPLWPFKDRHTSMLCDVVMMASGLFRMPVFFLIAGYFAARIYGKRGVTGLVRNRRGGSSSRSSRPGSSPFPWSGPVTDYAEALDRRRADIDGHADRGIHVTANSTRTRIRSTSGFSSTC